MGDMDVSSGSRVETQFLRRGGGDAPLAGGGVARVSCVAGAELAEHHRNRELLTRSPEEFKICQQQSSVWLEPPYHVNEE